MDQKQTSRQIQAKMTKKKIYAATLELMKDHAISEIKIKDICSAADISVGAFYHHFSNKKEVLSLYPFPEFRRQENNNSEEPLEELLSIIDLQNMTIEKNGVNFSAQFLTIQLQEMTGPYLKKGEPFYETMCSYMSDYLVQIGKSDEYDLIVVIDRLLRISAGNICYWTVSAGSFPLVETTHNDLVAYFQTL